MQNTEVKSKCLRQTTDNHSITKLHFTKYYDSRFRIRHKLKNKLKKSFAFCTIMNLMCIALLVCKHIVLGAIGVHPEFDHRQIGVAARRSEVLRVTEPFKLASHAFKREGSIFDIGGVKIGGPEVVVMAGPCAVESEEQSLKLQNL